MGFATLRALALLAVSLGLLAGCSSSTNSEHVDARHSAAAVSSPAVVRNVAGSTASAGPGASRLSVLPGNDELRVMSFNVRVSTLIDTINHWHLRKNAAVETIRDADPDLLGVQECLNSQAKYLQKKLSDYQFFGVGRENGKRGGEMCGIFFRKSRFEQLDGGHFWLSEKPNKPGSQGWGAMFPRMVTWVKLRPRDGSQPSVYFFNTHFDVFSGRARVESARLLRQRMQSIAGGAPTIVTGDFNTEQGSDAYRLLVTASPTVGPTLIDTYRTIHPTTNADAEGTRHSFWGGQSGPRIDWILASDDFRVVDAAINHSRPGGRLPSDHFPVQATLRMNRGSSFADTR